MPVSAELLARFALDAYIISADRGLQSALAAGITPHMAVGDWDSYEGALPEGIQCITLPHEKNDTDTLFAARLALKQGCSPVYIMGAMGGRLDHTMANIGTLRFLEEQGTEAFLLSEDTLCAVVRNGRKTFARNHYFYLSVLALDRQVKGVTLRGLYYPLENATLTQDFPLGVSNEFIADTAEVEVKKGAALVICTVQK